MCCTWSFVITVEHVCEPEEQEWPSQETHTMLQIRLNYWENYSFDLILTIAINSSNFEKYIQQSSEASIDIVSAVMGVAGFWILSQDSTWYGLYIRRLTCQPVWFFNIALNIYKVCNIVWFAANREEAQQQELLLITELAMESSNTGTEATDLRPEKRLLPGSVSQRDVAKRKVHEAFCVYAYAICIVITVIFRVFVYLWKLGYLKGLKHDWLDGLASCQLAL